MPAKLIFVATRDPDYPRVAMTLATLRAKYHVHAIVSPRKRYASRLIILLAKLVQAWLRGEFRDTKLVVIGFLAQPIVPFVRLFWRGPIISDAFVSIYDTLVFDKRKVKPNSLFAKLCYGLDANMLKQSQLCLTDTSTHADYFRTTFDTPTPIARLWVSAPEEALTPQERSSTADYRTTDAAPFQVFFWGNYIPLQGVDTIVKAAALLRKENIQFTLTGRGQTYPACRAMHEQLGGDNIRFHAWMPPDEIRSHAAKSHVILGIFGTSDKASRVIPNKVFQSLALGMPVITRESTAIDELLADGHDVLLTPPNDARKLADKILWVRANYLQALQIGQLGHATFEREASPPHVAAVLTRHVDAFLKSTSPPSSASTAENETHTEDETKTTTRVHA